MDITVPAFMSMYYTIFKAGAKVLLTYINSNALN